MLNFHSLFTFPQNDSAIDCSHTHGLYSDNSVPNSVFCHLLQHLEENNNNVLGLLSCESSEIFLRYFKDSLNELVLSVLGMLTPTTGALVHNAGSCFVVLIAALLYDRKFE